jgi:hypothetical protein
VHDQGRVAWFAITSMLGGNITTNLICDRDGIDFENGRDRLEAAASAIYAGARNRRIKTRAFYFRTLTATSVAGEKRAYMPRCHRHLAIQVTYGNGRSVAQSFSGLRRLPRDEPIKMGFDFFEMHHVHVFVMKVEQVHLVDHQLGSIVSAFLDNGDMKSIRVGVDRAGADAAGRTLTAN